MRKLIKELNESEWDAFIAERNEIRKRGKKGKKRGNLQFTELEKTRLEVLEEG